MIKKKKKQGRHQRPPARGQFVWTLLSGHFIFRLLGSPKGSAESGLKEKQYPGQLIFDYAPTNPAAAVRITTTKAAAGTWSNNQSAVAGMLASKNCQRKRAEKYYCTFWLLPIKRLLRDALHLSAHVLSFDFHRLQLAPQIIFALGLIEFWLHFSAALTTATILKLAFQVRRLAVRQSAFLCCHRCGHSVTHANHVKT